MEFLFSRHFFPNHRTGIGSWVGLKVSVLMHVQGGRHSSKRFAKKCQKLPLHKPHFRSHADNLGLSCLRVTVALFIGFHQQFSSCMDGGRCALLLESRSRRLCASKFQECCVRINFVPKNWLNLFRSWCRQQNSNSSLIPPFDLNKGLIHRRHSFLQLCAIMQCSAAPYQHFDANGYRWDVSDNSPWEQLNIWYYINLEEASIA